MDHFGCQHFKGFVYIETDLNYSHLIPNVEYLKLKMTETRAGVTQKHAHAHARTLRARY